MNRLILFLFLLYLKSISGAKILALMALASPSHHIWNSAITNELARRGHEITYFSPNKDANPLPNVRQIHAEDVYAKIHAEMNLESLVEMTSYFDQVNGFREYFYLNCKLIIESKGFDTLLDIVKKERYDLILADITANECIYPIADEQKGVPIVGISAYGGAFINNYLVGNPEMLAIKANTYLQISNNMTLLERIQNVMAYLHMMHDRFYVLLPEQQELARTKFPNNPDVHGFLDRMSLVLANTHFSLDDPLPAVPALIDVAGVHIKPAKPLPEDLKKFLDEATHGAILLSLGSNLKSSQLSEEKRKIILDALRELAPVRILWKFETDLPGKPENVMIKKWLPQNDIYGHPNLKIFFTHSGLLSTQEAIYHGKPIIGMPFFADQLLNVQKCVREGLGERVDFVTLDKNNLTQTIKKVLTNPRYKERAEHLSRVFKDRPHTPLETAVFWIEYVIRHKGAPHLRSASLNLSWYQNNLLDVIVILSTGIILTLLMIHIIVKSLFRCITGGKPKGKKLKKK